MLGILGSLFGHQEDYWNKKPEMPETMSITIDIPDHFSEQMKQAIKKRVLEDIELNSMSPLQQLEYLRKRR